jgi:hypothetical protein
MTPHRWRQRLFRNPPHEARQMRRSDCGSRWRIAVLEAGDARRLRVFDFNTDFTEHPGKDTPQFPKCYAQIKFHLQILTRMYET